MQITKIRLRESKEDKELAYADITMDGQFIVSGLRILKAEDGEMTVAFPSHKESSGEYKELCFPIKLTLREEITIAVISEYERLYER